MRTIYRWTIEQGLSFDATMRGFAVADDRDWSDWTDWRVQLDLADRDGLVRLSFDSEAGTVGQITFGTGAIKYHLSPAQTTALTATTTVGRGKEKEQWQGIAYATDPEYPDEPYPLAIVKAVVRES